MASREWPRLAAACQVFTCNEPTPASSCSTSWTYRPMRGGEKVEFPQAMFPGMQREQRRPPPHHLHPPPPPHRAWDQLDKQYDPHLPPQGHPVLSLPNEHSLRLYNGGYAGGGAPLLNPHLHPNRPLLKEQHVPRGPPLLGDDMRAQVHQQRGYPGKMPAGPLKRPGPPLGEHSVIQHTPPPPLHIPAHPVLEDCPGPSKRKKSSEQAPHPGLQRFSNQSSVLSQPPPLPPPALQLPPKPAFWNPIHKDSGAVWQPQTSDRKNTQSQEIQDNNKRGMDRYTTKSSPNSSSPSNRSPPVNSAPESYNQGYAPHLHKNMLQPQARTHPSPHSSYPSPSSKVELALSCQAVDPSALHSQRSPLSGGRGGGRTPTTPTRGDQDRQSSPANASATSNKNSSSVPYSHFQPHPGLGHQGAPPAPPLPPASSTSVPQQQQSGPHDAWRYQSRLSSHSLEPGIFVPPGLLPHPQQSHNQVVDGRLPGLSQHQHKVSPPPPLTNSTRTPVITSTPPMSLPSCTVSRYSSSNSVSMGTTSPPAGCSVNSSNNSWQRGKEPKPHDSTSADPGPKSQVDALLQGGCQSQPQEFIKPHKQKMSYYAQAKPDHPPPQFSSSALFSSGHHRAEDSPRGSPLHKPRPLSLSRSETFWTSLMRS
ncbi:extensin [Austrofundulus limnaeus]|uniref:Extensin n=1 Tax=Austrofundulus limnaeus TaxID=52670 RepID=A0A2I4D0U1_AUSLI|nr:PREDICTED: extensin-like [Austrofundulus limnaeus]